jgi:repressor LexA
MERTFHNVSGSPKEQTMPRTVNLVEKISALRRFYRQERRLPSYSEMLPVFGYKSKSPVFVLLQKIIAAGWLVRDTGGKLAPTRKLSGQWKLLGAVEAGFPSPAEEELVDVLSLDEFLIGRPDATYMLTVSGDSMTGAGIMPGDIVLVERGANPKNGSVVVACVDDEWTLKFYFKDMSGVRLEPANPKFKTIRPKESLAIGGVVRGVVRKYAV